MPIEQQDLLDQAIIWSMRLREGRADVKEFTHWLSHPEHHAVWERLQGVERDLAEVQAQHLPVLNRVLASRRKLLQNSVLGTLVGVGALQLWQHQRSDYATDVGEQNSIKLADGSRLDLNTASAIRLDQAHSRIYLVKGEIALEVRDYTWTITTEHAPLALANGWMNLRVERAQLDLVIEAQAAYLKGQRVSNGQWRYRAQSGLQSRANQGLDQTAWRAGAMVVDALRLDDFLQELARYRRGILRCDPAVADKRVSGVFQLADTERILQVVAANLGLRLHKLAPLWLSMEARA